MEVSGGTSIFLRERFLRMDKKIYRLLATVLTVTLLFGCGANSGADNNSNASTESSTTGAQVASNAASSTDSSDSDNSSDVDDSSDGSSDSDESSSGSSEEEEIDEELKVYQDWINKPANQMVLLNIFNTPEDIIWTDILEEAAMRDFIGHPFGDDDDDMISDFLEISGISEEGTKKVRVITDEEIAEYTKEKTGSSFSISKDDLKEDEHTWFYSDKFGVWYCYCGYLYSVDHEYHGMPEYEFECLDVAEDGDEVTLHVKSYTYSNMHKTQTEIKMKKNGGSYQVLSNVIQWEGGSVDSFTVDLPMLGGETTIYIYDDQRLTDGMHQPTGEYTYSAAIIRGEEAQYTDFEYGDHMEKLGDVIGVKEMGTGDYNMDNVIDLVAIVEFENDIYPVLYYFQDDYYYTGFSLDYDMSEYAYSKVSDPTCEKVVGYLSDGHSGTGFADYKEAFRIFARNYYGSYKVLSKDPVDDRYFQFDLIYFNNDDIPELVINRVGCVFVFEFVDGYMYPIVDGWGYGAMGNAGYEYFERCGVIENFNQDHGGEEFYITYCKLNEEEHTMETTMYFHGINVDDDRYGDEGYYIYDDATEDWIEVSEDEYNEALDKLLENSGVDEYKCLDGEMTYEEVLKELKG